MTQRCKCEHWQECPTCAPQRFDAAGKRKPPEPTPLQACRAELDAMREVLALHEVGSAYAHRLAVMLECALLNADSAWNEAHALLDEYRAACRAEIIAASFRGQVKEWIEDDSGPRCTAFVEAGNVVPEVDTLTGDLFA